MSRLEATVVRAPADLLDRARALARRERTTLAAVVRSALEAELDAREARASVAIALGSADVQLAQAVGARLAAAREGAGLSRRDLGRAANLPADLIRDLERGRRLPGFDLLARLARALGVEAVALFPAAEAMPGYLPPEPEVRP